MIAIISHPTKTTIISAPNRKPFQVHARADCLKPHAIFNIDLVEITPRLIFKKTRGFTRNGRLHYALVSNLTHRTMHPLNKYAMVDSIIYHFNN